LGTHIFATNFVGSIDIRASREVFPIGVRSPEIAKYRPVHLYAFVGDSIAVAVLGRFR
jgi:hypothetical protein